MHNCGKNMVKTRSVTSPGEQMHQNLTMPDVNDQYTSIRLLLGQIFYNLSEYKYTSEWRKCFCQNKLTLSAFCPFRLGFATFSKHESEADGWHKSLPASVSLYIVMLADFLHTWCLWLSVTRVNLWDCLLAQPAVPFNGSVEGALWRSYYLVATSVYFLFTHLSFSSCAVWLVMLLS